MLAPDKFFELNGIWQKFFAQIDVVFDALNYLESFIQELVQKNGANGAVLRQGSDLILQTKVLHKQIVYCDNFKLLGGDPGKGTMKVEINGQIVCDATIVEAGAILKSDCIHLAPGVRVEAGALINGPTYIDSGSDVRQGAYLRGGCLIGKNCVIGHTTEIKNSAMLDEAKAGHFAYLGDSILGNRVNLGAGAKLANLPFNPRPFIFNLNGIIYQCTRKKLGAIIGDDCQSGCNSVINPGVILSKNSLIYPCKSVLGGYYPAFSRLK
jgi:bifunctional N-acetylglucosamine-1-phosphate-uridyltransferase/glucosamine-1-phosphate-acetyltransferase GlmU-like protein